MRKRSKFLILLLYKLQSLKASFSSLRLGWNLADYNMSYFMTINFSLYLLYSAFDMW